MRDDVVVVHGHRVVGEDLGFQQVGADLLALVRWWVSVTRHD
jgi:hypothetical protein